MTHTQRYQEGSLSKKHGGWYARYYECVREDGSARSVQRWQKIASTKDYPNKSDVKPLFVKFMQELNALGYHSNMNATIGGFVETVYLP
jgi:hypothetical protein